MIRITCCRCGTLERPNKESKGQFVLEFKDIGDFARWFNKSRRKLFFPKIREELTKSQLESFLNKSRSLNNGW